MATLVAVAANAYSFSVKDVVGTGYSVVDFSVSMENETPISVFFCQFVLPEGLEFKKDNDGIPEFLLGNRAKKSHRLLTHQTADGVVKVLGDSGATIETFLGNSGELFTGKILLTGKPGTYEVLVEDIQLVDSGITEYFCNDVKFTVTITECSRPTISKSMRYWFDDAASMTTVGELNGSHDVDVSSLIEGLHTIHYQLIDSENQVTIPYSGIFIKIPNGEYADKQTLRYWFDDETDTRICDANIGIQNLDISTLLEGVHTVHYQIVDGAGNVSYTSSCIFVIVKNVDQPLNETNLCYWFDEGSTKITLENVSSIHMLDASHLTEGYHTIYCQLVNNGNPLPSRSMSFFRGIYDVYIDKEEQYSQNTIDNDPIYKGRPSLKLNYNKSQPDVRGHLTVDADATLSLGKFVQTGNLGSNNTSNKYLREGDEYYHITTLVNNGYMRADNVFVNERFYRDRWHFISLPFNANISDIAVPDGTFWAIRTYDGEQRAAGNMNAVWTNLHNGEQMKAGQGYILQLTSEKSDKAVELSFASVNDADKNRIFTAKDVSVPLVEHEAEFAHNRGWNFIGNPYPSFYDTRNMDLSGTITVWNGNGYSAYSLRDDSYVLMPFEAFFIQKPLDADAVTFSAAGRQHTHEATVQAAKQNVLRSKPSERRLFNFTLSHDGMEDHARVVFNPNALLSYESDKDAAKFMENTPTAPQLYSIEGGVKFAINERPELDGIMTFSMYAPVDGEYVLYVDATEADMSLLDTETGEITALGNSDYIFYTDAGSYDARFVIAMGDAHITSVSQIAAGNEGEIQVADQCLKFKYLRDKDVRVYGADGQVYYQARTASGQVRLGKGVYVISVDGQTTKVAVK